MKSLIVTLRSIFFCEDPVEFFYEVIFLAGIEPTLFLYSTFFGKPFGLIEAITLLDLSSFYNFVYLVMPMSFFESESYFFRIFSKLNFSSVGDVLSPILSILFFFEKLYYFTYFIPEIKLSPEPFRKESFEQIDYDFFFKMPFLLLVECDR